MIAWIKRSWFRHILTLRPFIDGQYNQRGVGLGLLVGSTWDEGWHADVPLAIEVTVIKWTIWFGIKDTN